MRSHAKRHTKPSMPEEANDQRQPKTMATQGMASAPPKPEPLSKIATATLRSSAGTTRHCLARAWPVESFADAEQESACRKTGNRVHKACCRVHRGPQHHGDGQPDACVRHIEKNATQKPGDRVRDLEGAENARQVGVTQMKLRRDHRREHGECLAADVVNGRGA